MNQKYKKRSDEIKQYFEEKYDAVRMYQNEREIMEAKIQTLINEKEIMGEEVKTFKSEKQNFQNKLNKSCTIISVEEDKKSLNVQSTDEAELVHLREEVHKLTNEVCEIELEKSKKEMLLENVKNKKNDLHEKLLISNSKYRQLDSEMDTLKNHEASEVSLSVELEQSDMQFLNSFESDLCGDNFQTLNQMNDHIKTKLMEINYANVLKHSEPTYNFDGRHV